MENIDRKTYPCPSCNGTGRYRGIRYHQPKEHCFKCGGRGYFVTSHEQRIKARQKRVEAKERKMQAFESMNASMVEYMREVSSWNIFACQMLQTIKKYGKLTENQFAAVEKMMAKHRKQKEIAKENMQYIKLTRINELFETAQKNGLKRPILNIGKISLKIAPKNGKNPNCLYVKYDGVYVGKIGPNGGFQKSYGSNEANVVKILQNISYNPYGEMKKHGNLTGSCSCCGRKLSDEKSIDMGIGPVCAKKWGIIH